MRFLTFTGMAVAVFALLTSTGGNGARPVHAAGFTLEGQAVGSTEIPICTSGASALVRFVYDDSTNKIDYSVTVLGLTADFVTGSHFHRGPRGVAGPIIYPLSNTGFTQISGTVQVVPSDVAEMRSGNFYFNVHSKECPAGFGRLQMEWPGLTGVVPAAAPRPVTPPSTGDAGLADSSGSFALPLALAALVTLSGLGALVAVRRRA